MVHEIPYDSKSETRLFVIFSIRGLATTAVSVIIGMVIGMIINMMSPFNISYWIFIIIFAIIGFVIGTVKIPEIKSIPITKSISDMYFYEIVAKYIKFKQRAKLYVIYKD